MAKTKQAGTSKNFGDSRSKYLGVKLFAGQKTKPGSILIRQRGTKYRPGDNVRRGNDDTLYAVTNGVVEFQKKAVRLFDNGRKKATIIHVRETKPTLKTKAKETTPSKKPR